MNTPDDVGWFVCKTWDGYGTDINALYWTGKEWEHLHGPSCIWDVVEWYRPRELVEVFENSENDDSN